MLNFQLVVQLVDYHIPKKKKKPSENCTGLRLCLFKLKLNFY